MSKELMDALTAMVVPVATLAAWVTEKLPSFAALASILWIGWQWWHSKPMVEWRRNRRARK